ncbi:hypothetical protein [Spartinivicinus poritis]|uniref:Uncharacterized protein n=1 Tax=Spartinivicinus poritis TaxID=2994640 RepID=A0ABT5U7C6_9GAMM|nr:hypothetical protein [Spartinivicinus sp. A2-2]MDE1462277.1 hypothetical protein [Spartinivicinus sp. A2-2]
MNKVRLSPSIILLFGRVTFVGLKPLSLILSVHIASPTEIVLFTFILASLPMVTALASIPVHKDLYSSPNGQKDSSSKVFLNYLSAILVLLLMLCILLGSISVLYCYQSGINMNLSVVMVILCMMDKILDEIMRWCEFTKQFKNWFLWGIIRNCWCLLFVFSLLLLSAEEALVVSIIIGFMIFTLSVWQCFGFSVAGINLIKGISLISRSKDYYVASFFTGAVKNSDKLLASLLLPSVSPYLVSTSMIVGGGYLLFDALIIAPRRKLLANRPVIFVRVIFKQFRFKMLLALCVSLLCFMMTFVLSPEIGVWARVVLLVTFSVLAGTCLSLFQDAFFWKESYRRFKAFYFKQVLYFIIIVASGYVSFYALEIEFYYPFFVSILSSLVCLFSFFPIFNLKVNDQLVKPYGASG